MTLSLISFPELRAWSVLSLIHARKKCFLKISYNTSEWMCNLKHSDHRVTYNCYLSVNTLILIGMFCDSETSYLLKQVSFLMCNLGTKWYFNNLIHFVNGFEKKQHELCIHESNVRTKSIWYNLYSIFQDHEDCVYARFYARNKIYQGYLMCEDMCIFPHAPGHAYAFLLSGRKV